MNDLLGRSIKPALLIVGPAVDKHVKRTAQNVDAVEELILSQETAPGTHRTSSGMHSRTWRTL